MILKIYNFRETSFLKMKTQKIICKPNLVYEQNNLISYIYDLNPLYSDILLSSISISEKCIRIKIINSNKLNEYKYEKGKINIINEKIQINKKDDWVIQIDFEKIPNKIYIEFEYYELI
jgi:hypothetical protein